jgi:hypothetical protein
MDGIKKNENDDEYKAKEVEYKNMLNKGNNNTSKKLQKISNNDNLKLLKTNKKIFEKIIPESIIKSQKRYSNIENLNSNFKFVSNKKIHSKPLKINDQEYYKNFFMLTYQAIKLNSENPKIFEKVK